MVGVYRWHWEGVIKGRAGNESTIRSLAELLALRQVVCCLLQPGLAVLLMNFPLQLEGTVSKSSGPQQPDNLVITGKLVGQDCRELETVPNVQLLQDRMAPADDFFLAVRALQVLSCQIVVAINIYNLAHVRVHAS